MRWSCLNLELLLLFHSVIQAIHKKREKNKEKKFQPRFSQERTQGTRERVWRKPTCYNWSSTNWRSWRSFFVWDFRFWFVFIRLCARSNCFLPWPPPPSFRPQFSFREVVSLTLQTTKEKRHWTKIKKRPPTQARVERMMLWLFSPDVLLLSLSPWLKNKTQQQLQQQHSRFKREWNICVQSLWCGLPPLATIMWCVIG